MAIKFGVTFIHQTSHGAARIRENQSTRTLSVAGEGERDDLCLDSEELRERELVGGDERRTGCEGRGGDTLECFIREELRLLLRDALLLSLEAALGLLECLVRVVDRENLNELGGALG